MPTVNPQTGEKHDNEHYEQAKLTLEEIAEVTRVHGCAASVDVVRWASGSALSAYVSVFFVEGLLFIVAARLAAGIGHASPIAPRETPPQVSDIGRNLLHAES